MMSKNSIVPFLKDYLIKFLTRPFLLDTNAWIEENLLPVTDRKKHRNRKLSLSDSEIIIILSFLSISKLIVISSTVTSTVFVNT